MKLFCRKLGKGKPLVIIHGLFGLSDNWLSIAKRLADSYRCYILDMRNHGRSPHSDNFSYADMVEDIYEFLTDFNLRTVSILGHSMGGMTAMKFAFEYAHRLEKLIVVDIAPKSYPTMHQEILDGLRAIPIAKIKSRKEADQILKDFVPALRIRQFLLKNLYRKEDHSYAWRINLNAIHEHAAYIGRDISGKLQFEKPTLFIRGEQSNFISDEDELRIMDIFPRASIIKIPGASHWVHAEKPDDFLTAVLSFLNKNNNTTNASSQLNI